MTPLTCLTDALASYRLTRLVVEDRITAPFRNRVHARYGSTGPGYLIDCPWCLSLWASLAVVTARRITPRLWGPLADALAYSTIAGLIADKT